MNHRLRILYLGHDFGTSQHRANALMRLGHSVDVIDSWGLLPGTGLFKKAFKKLAYEAGPAFLEPYIRKKLAGMLRGSRFGLIWNNQCELIGPATAAMLRRHTNSMVAYVNDDPFSPRDKRRFSLYRHSVRHFDLNVVVRRPNVPEFHACGAPKVLRVFMSADEVAHLPFAMKPEERKPWRSDVAFIGTWMPERGPFLARLIRLGVPLTIYGDRWQKAREWPVLRKAWRGPNLVGGEYVKAIQTEKVCIGLLSIGNRDLHTNRSVEIPYIGSVLCAERTVEHMAMYREDNEASFWNTPEECAEKCCALLSNESWRNNIARAGRRRCLTNNHFNEPIMEKILNTVKERSPETL